MAYSFEISYPIMGRNMEYSQTKILQEHPTCQYSMKNTSGSYHRTVYRTDSPQEIAKIASSLKRENPDFYIGFITHDNNTIYYHPNELALLSAAQQQHYRLDQSNLNQTDRVLHDFLVNLYRNVPLR